MWLTQRGVLICMAAFFQILHGLIQKRFSTGLAVSKSLLLTLSALSALSISVSSQQNLRLQRIPEL